MKTNLTAGAVGTETVTSASRAMVMEVLKFNTRRQQFEVVELEGAKSGFYGILQAGISIHRGLAELEEGNTIQKVSTLEGDKNPFPTDKYENSHAMGLAISKGFSMPETVIYKVMYRLNPVVSDASVKELAKPANNKLDLI